MTFDQNQYMRKETMLQLINHYPDADMDSRVFISLNFEKFLSEIFQGHSIRLWKKNNIIPDSVLQKFDITYVEQPEDSDVLTNYFVICDKIDNINISQNDKGIIQEFLRTLNRFRVESRDDITGLYEQIKKIWASNVQGRILDVNGESSFYAMEILLRNIIPNKLESYSIFNKLSVDCAPSEELQRFFHFNFYPIMMNLVMDIVSKVNLQRIDYNVLAAYIILTFKHLEIDPDVYLFPFVRYLNSKTAHDRFGDKLKDRVLELESNKTDVMDIIKMIPETDNTLVDYHHTGDRIVELYQKDKVSNECRNRTLMFGDRISDCADLNSVVHRLRMLDENTIRHYTHFKDISFKLNEDDNASISFELSPLRLIVYCNTEIRNLIQMKSDTGNDFVYLLFNTSENDNVYGITLETFANNPRRLIAIKKNGSYNYKLMVGDK